MAKSKAQQIAGRANGGGGGGRTPARGINQGGTGLGKLGLGLPPGGKAGAMSYVPSNIQPFVTKPRTFVGKFGQQPFGRLAGMSMVDRILQSRQDQEALRQHLQGQIDPTTGQAKVDYREGGEPTMTDMSSYLRDRLGTGMTPQEKSAFFAEQQAPIRAQEQQANEAEATREAQAGIDPRSGVAAGRAAGIEAATGRELAEAGRQTELADLARKQQIEQETANQAALEEQRRQGEVTSQLGRLGTIEQGMGGLATLGEQQRQFDYELAEGQRQAALRRQDIQNAANKMQPSTLENVSSGISGFLGGLGA